MKPAPPGTQHSRISRHSRQPSHSNVVAPSNTIPSIQGLTFVVQNSNNTTNPGTGGGTNSTADANLTGSDFGYSNPSTTAINNSVAVKFDLNSYGNQSYSSRIPPNSTGLYINGGPEGAAYAANDLNAYGINLYSGDVFSSTIVYDGSLLTMTLLDTTTNAQARYTWPVIFQRQRGATQLTSASREGRLRGGGLPKASFVELLEWIQ